LRASVASDAEANREDRVEVVVTQDVLQMSAVVATAIRPHDGRARPQPRHPDGSVRPTSIISSVRSLAMKRVNVTTITPEYV